MKRNSRTPEILAPAGSLEAVFSAVCGGADAVYFGAAQFNARRGAKNFTDEEMQRGITFCKSRGVKTYLTLNTLVTDRELPLALELGEKAGAMGVDALIVTDLGLIKLLAKTLPKTVELHASTQLSVHSQDGADAAVRLGCSRVVLARELSKKNIQYITEKSAAETEVFVHGAMCYSVSGQCLMSSVIGRRSGNRGACAQPCRLPYRLGGKSGALISLKDMCLLKKVKELSEIGVSSLKIEGRMKRAEYAGAISAAYKKALVSGTEDSDVAKLSSVFNRGGFTEGGYSGERGQSVLGSRTKDEEDSAVFSEVRRCFEAQRKSFEQEYQPTDIEINPTAKDDVRSALKEIIIIRRSRQFYGFFETAAQAAFADGLDRIFLPPDECMKLSDLSNVGVRLPFVLYDDEGWAFEGKLKTLAARGALFAEVNNIGQIALVQRLGLHAVGGIGLNLFNSLSIAVAKELGLAEATLSPECSLPQIRDMRPPLPAGLFAYGRLPLMHTAHCVVKNNLGCSGTCRLPVELSDRTGTAFPVVKDMSCRNTIYNSAPLWLADKKKDLVDKPLTFLSLYFTTEKPEECRRVIQAYRSKEEAAPPKAFTRGLYMRGVL